MAEPARSRELHTNPQTPVDSLSLGTAGYSQSTLPTPVGRHPAPPPPPEAPTIAGYQLLDEIARGGMGCVYAANELKLDRDVAIKTLLPGRDAKRFITEARITARLPHPSIPPMYELGTLADGAPYLAMKRIHGQTLADLLKQRSDPHAELPRFVQIFEQIAQAVGFAHHRGIIHRDLKPLNVMVGEFGEVQVMDWGLAKELGTSDGDAVPVASAPASLAGQTTVGAILGSPGYLAPEQARGEAVDARADVFALGSLLAAILTGQPSVTGTSRDELIERAARAELDEVNARLKASGADEELIALARRCLAARAEDRPASGREVAAEVAIYRAGVEARLQQAETERARAETKAAEQSKRRRVVQWAAATIAVILLIGIAGTGWGLIAARRANALTAKRLQQIELINNSVLGIFTEFDIREIKQSGVPVEAALAQKLIQAGHQLDAQAIDDPLVLAALQNRLGATLRGLGRHDEAVEFLTKARDTRRRLLGPDNPDTLTTADQLGTAYIEAGRVEAAIPLLEEVVQRRRKTLVAKHPDTLASINNLAMAYLEAGHPDRALPLMKEALEGRKTVLSNDDAATLTSMGNLALIYQALGEYDQVLPLMKETFDRMATKLDRDHPDMLTSLNNLAMAYRGTGQIDEALRLLEECVQRNKARLGPHHPATLTAMNNLGLCYSDANQIGRALSLFEEILELKRTHLGPDHPETLIGMNNLAVAYQDDGQVDKALPLYQETLQLRQKELGTDHPLTLLSMAYLAMCYRQAGDFDKAAEIFAETVQLMKAKRGFPPDETVLAMYNLGTTYALAGNAEQAAATFQDYVEEMRKLLRSASPELAGTFVKVAPELISIREFAAAEMLLREALTISEQQSPDDWTTFQTRSLLGEALLGQEKFPAAEPLLVQGYEGLKARAAMISADENAVIPAALDRLIAIYKQQNQAAKVTEYELLRSQYPAK